MIFDKVSIMNRYLKHKYTHTERGERRRGERGVEKEGRERKRERNGGKRVDT